MIATHADYAYTSSSAVGDSACTLTINYRVLISFIVAKPHL